MLASAANSISSATGVSVNAPSELGIVSTGGGRAQGGHSGEQSYDWANEDNLARWRGLFVGPLEKVLRQVHPSLMAQKDALDYVEDLILRLLAMLTARPTPTLVEDIRRRVKEKFPEPIDEWALAEAKIAMERGKKKCGLVLPVDKVHLLLKEELLHYRVEDGFTVCLVAVLEYISADILKLTGNYVKNFRHIQITRQDIKVAMCADKVLMDMFHQDGVLMDNGVSVGGDEEPDEAKKAQSFEEVVKDLIMDEKLYLRDLHMITKVFREILQREIGSTAAEIDAIFSNITEITELTVTLISSLEDTLEMTEEGNFPIVGPCFEELAEAEEFDVYEKYAKDILSPRCRLTLENLLPRQIVSEALRSCGKGFREAVKFYLPKLLLGPIYHCFHYFTYIEILRTHAPSQEDRDTLKQVAAMITPLRSKLTQSVHDARRPGEIFTYRKSTSRMSRQQALQKVNQLQQSISGWEGKDLSTNSSEIVCQGKLKVIDNKKRYKDHYVFLCDGMIIDCKQNTSKRGSVSSSQSGAEYRLIRKYLIRKVDVVDRDDNGPDNFTFELVPRDQPKIIFMAESEDEKNSWMAALVMLNTKFMLERLLDVILTNEERKYPLRFPPSDKYKFAEEDTPTNIVFEDKEVNNGGQLIKGATLVKLVERLTYHKYADPTFVKTFLTTYRSFSSPEELLDLLIARFQIPEPEFGNDSDPDSEHEEKNSKLRITQDLKRFREEYCQPVQFRVLNVLKHWVDQHFDDFENDQELLNHLTSFLNSISGKSMRKWVECISKFVQRRKCNDGKDKKPNYSFHGKEPSIETHLEATGDSSWPEIMKYHPIEIARQLTLLEFQYYRAVKPSELVDQAWTREDKDKRSPNLLKMIRHTSNLTRYLQKLIVETENFEERLAVAQRTLEIMMVLQEYNNFNGVIAITAVFNSSEVYRLSHTKDRLPSHLIKALEEASAYIKDHCKLYWEKLRSINPPCVPFFGQYQTNILFLEEGNPDFLHNTSLINFTKRRKVAEIISEIQQYQNQPYCLQEFPELRAFLENLDPFPNMSEKEITDYLWSKSTEIEPKNPVDKKKIIEGKVRWNGMNLRSPGIKIKSAGRAQPPPPLPKIKSHSRSHHSETGNHSEDNASSPLTSPIFRNSPQSGPSTPVTQIPNLGSPPPSASSIRDCEPDKIPVILPHGSVPSASSLQALGPIHSPGLPPSHSSFAALNNSGPPPLPPKPSRMNSSGQHFGGGGAAGPSGSSSLCDHPPALPNRQNSSPPPPPLPPRRDQVIGHAASRGQWSGSGHRPPPVMKR